jgi:Cytochrome P450
LSSTPRSSADYAAGADPRASDHFSFGADPRASDHFSFGAGRRICPGARLAENTLELAIASLLWAFEACPPLEGTEKLREGRMDTGPDAFEQSAFGGPKPFAVRFVPRSSYVVNVVRGNWTRKRGDGYLLRRFHIKNEKA